MNEELRELFNSSNLTKLEFSKKIGVNRIRLWAILKKDAFELKPSTFKKYKSKFDACALN